MAHMTQTRALALFNYDALSGRLIWKQRPASDFATARACNTWNSRSAGKPAGYLDVNGYWYVTIGRAKLPIHRVVWLMVRGQYRLYLDHINGITTDNRVQNLRDSGPRGNSLNKAIAINNRSGHTGVHWHSGRQRWIAGIRVNGSFRQLGMFKSKEQAIAARAQANERFGFHPNHGLRLPSRSVSTNPIESRSN